MFHQRFIDCDFLVHQITRSESWFGNVDGKGVGLDGKQVFTLEY